MNTRYEKCGEVNFLVFALLISGLIPMQIFGMAPEFEVSEDGVRIEGVNRSNPIIYDNDWWFDVFDNNYLWSQASLGEIHLRGHIVSRDMWEWKNGYTYSMEQCIQDARKAIDRARESGIMHVPRLRIGSSQALIRPESGKIEETISVQSEGSQLIVREAMKAHPDAPLIIVAGGPMTTVANALLTNPEIADRLIVFNLTVSGGYNGKDAWAVYVVLKKTRYVDWGGGDFWDKDSVFKAEDFHSLPDNSFTSEMKDFIKTDLGRANQLGDGAPLVWLSNHACWKNAEYRSAVWNGSSVQFNQLKSGESPDLIVIPKSATDLVASRNEFFRVLGHPELFPAK